MDPAQQLLNSQLRLQSEFVYTIKTSQKQAIESGESLTDTDIARLSGVDIQRFKALKDKKLFPSLDEMIAIMDAIGYYAVMAFEKKEKLGMHTSVSLKRLSDSAKIPTKGRAGDAGYDLYASEASVIPAMGSALIPTGVSIKLPNFTVGRILSRSGLSVKHKIECGAGVIDPNYTGELKVHLYNHSDEAYPVSVGDRIAQLVILPKMDVDFLECDSLEESDRNSDGFGSSGK
jgi:dUTP pyrophosphatase